jgi:arginase
VVPITLADEGLDAVDRVEAKVVLLDQLGAALDVIAPHDPARIATLGRERAVSVAPFSALAHRYSDDLAIVWVDSHPGIGAGERLPGFHATAVHPVVRPG